jgi:hypothetical protein
LKTIVTPTPPTLGIADAELNGSLQRTKVGNVRKHTIVATLENVLGPSIIGRHHWQPTGGRFQQGQTEGFSERGIDKHTPQTGSPSI